MLLYSSDMFFHKFSIILYFLLNSREQTERLFGLESFQGMKANYTQSNYGITIIIYIIIIISTLRIRSHIKQQQKKLVFRIETWHQVFCSCCKTAHISHRRTSAIVPNRLHFIRFLKSIHIIKCMQEVLCM